MPTYTIAAPLPPCQPLHELLYDLVVPQDWADRRRLERYERDHADPFGRTWAAYRHADTGVWSMYAPGSPAPSRWPTGTEPYLTKAAATFTAVDCDAAMPLRPGDDNKLRAALAVHHGAIARLVVSGIQWSDNRHGRPVVYLQMP